MKFKHLLISGVLTILVAFGLLTVFLPQAAAAGPPQSTYGCFMCPTATSIPTGPYVTGLSKALAQDECRANAVFCVDLSTGTRGNPIACMNCR